MSMGFKLKWHQTSDPLINIGKTNLLNRSSVMSIGTFNHLDLVISENIAFLA